MKEHRTVDFAKDVFPNLNDEIGPDADDVVVEGRVMQLAQGKAVGDYRIASRLSIRDDVCSVKQFFVTKLAKRACAAIRSEDSFTKACLMKTLLHEVERIRPSCVFLERELGKQRGIAGLECDLEGQI